MLIHVSPRSLHVSILFLLWLILRRTLVHVVHHNSNCLTGRKEPMHGGARRLLERCNIAIGVLRLAPTWPDWGPAHLQQGAT